MLNSSSHIYSMLALGNNPMMSELFSVLFHRGKHT
jgi:hypothetical protein